MKLKKFFLKSTNSTNDFAIKKIKEGKTSGIVISEIQKKGRGRFGNLWISLKGNLFMSIFFKIKQNITIKKITKKNCNLIKEILTKFVKKDHKIMIKQPNDILINNEKICGILQETLINDGNKFLIVGIGLNIVKSPKIHNYKTGYLNNYSKKKLNKLLVFKKVKLLYEKKINYFN